MSDLPVGKFFDSLTDEYTSTILRCFPRYPEMLSALLDYLPTSRSFDSILELGCGTGNLSELLSRRFPDANIRFVDIASESLGTCRERLGQHARLTYQESDFRALSFGAGSFDLVVSSISVHHLDSTAKQALFSKVCSWLSPGGTFAFADQFRGTTDELYAQHIAKWKKTSLDAGSTEEEFAMWMEHQREHDHHDSIADQFQWLSDAGFENVDCVWRCLLWAVVQGTRP